MSKPVLFYCIVVFISIFLLAFSQLFLRLTLDRRIRREMPFDKKYDFVTDWYFGYWRAICFGFAACFEWANKSWVIRDHYDGFDVKNFANNFEKILSYISVIALFIVSTSAFVVPILSFLGYI